jgi:hypothetical protein
VFLVECLFSGTSSSFGAAAMDILVFLENWNISTNQYQPSNDNHSRLSVEHQQQQSNSRSGNRRLSFLSDGTSRVTMNERKLLNPESEWITTKISLSSDRFDYHTST